MPFRLNKILKVFVNKKKNNEGTGTSEEANDDQNIQNDSFQNVYPSLDNQFEIPIGRLKPDGQLLGSGIFGFIRSGTLQINDNKENNIKVAIKRVHNDSDSSCVSAIHKEIKVLASLAPHPNILTFIGFVKLLEIPEIVTELVDGGDLGTFLRSRKDIFEDQIVYSHSNPSEKTEQFKNTKMSSDQKSLCTFDLASYAYQIANGMEYLASVPCNHRNLALRNIFLSLDNTIRIGSFAFSGRHGNNENYLCQMAEDQLIPQFSTPPEVYEAMNTSEKSDVYGFAVLLNELFNLGEFDYGYPIEPFFSFPQPEFCPSQIYQLMLKCCHSDPALRPTFTECVTFLAEFLDTHNVQLRQHIDGRLLEVSKWQESIRNRVCGRDSIHPVIDVPFINSE
ncbi:unnamed protein product [Caenorhabditis brenneri]